MNNLIVTTMCENCCREISIVVDRKDYETWESGKKNIEEAMDYLESWETELLLNKTCKDCWYFFWGIG